MDKVIVYVDDAAYAQQILAPWPPAPMRPAPTGWSWPAPRA